MDSQRSLILPEKFEATENETGLTVERDLYNSIIELCADSSLGVRAVNKEACHGLILSLRDALQMMLGRETVFKWGSVPSNFKFGLRRKKTPPRLKQEQIEDVVSRLSAAIEGSAFTKTAMWADFVSEVEAVRDVLHHKLESMQRQSTQELSRQRAPEAMSPTMAVETVEASHSGTALKYSDLEQILEGMREYEVLQVEHEQMRIWANSDLGDGDQGQDNFFPDLTNIIHCSHTTGPHAHAPEPLKDDAERKRLQRFRDEIQFNAIPIKKMKASFNTGKLTMLFVWKVPVESDDRNETKDAAAIVEVEESVPKYHTRAQMFEFTKTYAAVTNLESGMLRNMYRTLTADVGAAINAKQKAVDERTILA